MGRVYGIGLCDLYELVGPRDGSRCGGYQVLILSDWLFVLFVMIALVCIRVVVGVGFIIGADDEVGCGG